MRHWPKAGICLGGLALAGCADSVWIDRVYYPTVYEPGHVALAAADGDTRTIVLGNPFAGDRDNRAVLAAMQGRNPGPKLHFVPAGRVDARYDYKLVMAFGAYPAGAVNFCQPDIPALRPASRGEIEIVAAFCIGDRLLSEAVGRMPAAAGANDPRFGRLIGDLLAALLPTGQANHLRSDDCRRPGC